MDRYIKSLNTQHDWVERPWGRFLVLYHTPHIWVKSIIILPGQKTSLQLHQHREEHWHTVDGNLYGMVAGTTFLMEPDQTYHVNFKQPHRLWNDGKYAATLTEVAYGQPEEDDIIRLQDDYGRVE